MKSPKINDEDFKYNKPTQRDIITFYCNFNDLVSEFASINNISYDSIRINRVVVFEICIRLDQRFDYYRYFHSEEDSVTEMSQSKETALISYWIVKYKPLSLEDKHAEQFIRDNQYAINEMFALHLIESYVVDYFDDLNQNVRDFFNPKNKEILLYNLQHRDISKEAFILYISSLVDKLEL